ncbi:phage protease [Fundidesulfovibrio butyratiphilus]
MRNASTTPRTTATAATAALAMQLALAGFGLPEGCNVQLFPEGDFTARDGRPVGLKDCTADTWRMDADIAAALIAQVSARETPLFVDYEHHTLTAKDKGHKAVAAGWINSLVYIPTKGLFANVAWTDAARQHIQADEYRYISPLFGFDSKTGAVLTLINAALTNNPALDGMAAVAAALETTRMEACMDPKDPKAGTAALSEELLSQLRWMLNLPVSATAAEIKTELDKLKAQMVGDATAAAGVSLAVLLHDKDARIADLTAQAAAPDPARFVPVATVTALSAELAETKGRLAGLEAQTGQAALRADMQAALTDGRLPKALEPWAGELLTANPQALKDYLATARPIAALSAMQTGGVVAPASAQGQAALSTEETQAAALLGMPENDYAKGKEAK